jgi:NAD(P)-dependent dehydrogenase (short-subunit alcohol dehydrogenase family)
VIFGRDQAKLDNAVLQITKSAVRNEAVAAYALDVGDPLAVARVMDQAVKECGPPRVLINSAGTPSADYFQNIAYEEFDRVMKTNLYGPRNVILALLKHLEGGGHVVNVASIAGLFSTFGYTAYGTSKWALLGFSHCLREDLRPLGVGLSLICPPDVDTPMLLQEEKIAPPETKALKAMAGFLTPEEVAQAIVKAVEKKRYMVVLGLKARFLVQLQRFSPAFVSRAVSDLTTGRARKKSGQAS